MVCDNVSFLTQEAIQDWRQPPSVHPDPRRQNVLHNPSGPRWEPVPAPVPVESADGRTWLVNTSPADGTLGLIVDCGALGNLGGKTWASAHARKAKAHERPVTQIPRERSLKVAGVGNGHNTATHNVRMPIVLQQTSGQFRTGDFEFPVLSQQPGSPSDSGGDNVPGLLGLETLENQLCILDHVHHKLYCCGPGDFDLKTCLPPGTEEYQLTHAPSGHLILPTDKYAEFDRRQAQGNMNLEPIHLLTRDPSHSSMPTLRDSSDSEPEGPRQRRHAHFDDA